MGKREISARDTRRKLVAAASRIVRQKGLAKTTVSEICAASGVAKGTFYIYFKHKEDILEELNCLDGFQDVLTTSLALDASFHERLTFFMCEFALYIERSGLKLCQDWTRNSATPELGKNAASREKLKFDRSLVQKLFVSGIEKGEVKSDAPIDILATTIVDALYGEMLCWVALDGEEGFAVRTRVFCDSILGNIITPYLN